MSGFVQSSKPFGSFGEKAESYLSSNFPSMVDSTIRNIHIGRNRDAAAGDRSGYRITGSASQAGGNYLEVPEKMLSTDLIKNREIAGNPTFQSRVSDSVKQHIIQEKNRLAGLGITGEDADKRVRDSLETIAHYDAASGKYVAEPMVRRTLDAVMPSMAMPYWNVSYTNRVFKQPMIQGLARNLVDVVGVPNVWADVLVMFAESFEGMARISGVAKTNGEHNDSAPVRNRFGQLVSEFVNIVVDYEAGYHESIVSGQPGNFLTSMGITDRDKYGRLMLEQLKNALWLFGAPEAGFDGLSQLAPTDLYTGTPANDIWTGASTTKGADIVEDLITMVGNMQEDLSFLPTSVRINVSPTLYKTLKWSMQSHVYNPSNPMSVIASGFKDSEILQANGAGFGKGLDSFTLVSDPFCMPNTPWNPNPSDLMFITFPTVKSAMGDMDSLVVAPVPIENFVLPNFPQRDGLQRTMLSRLGSIIAPVDGTIKIIRGYGIQS